MCQQTLWIWNGSSSMFFFFQNVANSFDLIKSAILSDGMTHGIDSIGKNNEMCLLKLHAKRQFEWSDNDDKNEKKKTERRSFARQYWRKFQRYMHTIIWNFVCRFTFKHIKWRKWLIWTSRLVFVYLKMLFICRRI